MTHVLPDKTMYIKGALLLKYFCVVDRYKLCTLMYLCYLFILCAVSSNEQTEVCVKSEPNEPGIFFQKKYANLFFMKVIYYF